MVDWLVFMQLTLTRVEAVTLASALLEEGDIRPVGVRSVEALRNVALGEQFLDDSTALYSYVSVSGSPLFPSNYNMSRWAERGGKSHLGLFLCHNSCCCCHLINKGTFTIPQLMSFFVELCAMSFLAFNPFCCKNVRCFTKILSNGTFLSAI